jgi:hypothetical protein
LTFSAVIFVLADGTGVSWPTGSERVGVGVKVGEGGISVAVTVARTWVTVGALSEASGGVAEIEELQAEISIVRIKIVGNIFFNVFSPCAILHKNTVVKPACLNLCNLFVQTSC